MSWTETLASAQQYSTHIYVGIVLLIGALALIKVLRSLTTTEKARKVRLTQRKKLDAVDTESPLKDATATAQDRGLDSITQNSTVMRRLLVPIIVLITVAMASLPLLSRVPATAVSVVVALATVIIGVAARPVIESAMSGLVISFSRLVNIGDTVRIDDLYGTIEDISITHTTIKLWDWRRYVVPNSRMLQQSIVNYSVYDKFEWTYVSFHLSYEVDLERVREIALDVPRESKFFARYEDPQFWIMELGEQGYEVWLAAWANTPSEAWQLRTDMRTGLILAFQKHDIPVQRMRHEIVSAPAAKVA